MGLIYLLTAILALSTLLILIQHSTRIHYGLMAIAKTVLLPVVLAALFIPLTWLSNRGFQEKYHNAWLMADECVERTDIHEEEYRKTFVAVTQVNIAILNNRMGIKNWWLSVYYDEAVAQYKTIEITFIPNENGSYQAFYTNKE